MPRPVEDVCQLPPLKQHSKSFFLNSSLDDPENRGFLNKFRVIQLPQWKLSISRIRKLIWSAYFHLCTEYRLTYTRSSRPEVFCKKDVLRNIAKFRGKHLCQSLFFNKVASLRPITLLKKRLWRRCFPVNFVKFLRTPFFIEHLWWLLLVQVFI